MKISDAVKKFLSKKAPEQNDNHSLSDYRIGEVTVVNRGISQTEYTRGVWFRPEYNLEEISVAEDVDSFIFNALKKKRARFLLAGSEIVGENETYVNYIKKRIAEIEMATSYPWLLLLCDTAYSLSKNSNCMWVKVRSSEASSGRMRTLPNGKELEPVAGYFILPFESLSFKTFKNGEIAKVMQEGPRGEKKEFLPYDLIHFYSNKKPGYVMGTPEILPVLNDIALLRRIEENVEQLIESNLYPLFHYQIGTDEHPERINPNGLSESQIVGNKIKYMPSGGVYISDHRHQITAIGSEGKALDVTQYLEYFKKRVYIGLSVSPVDMGEGDTANRATANVLSKAAIQDIEALQEMIKIFVENYVFNELLIEGGFEVNPQDPTKKVTLKFGSVDKETQIKVENANTLLFQNNLLTQNEARKRNGDRPFTEADRASTFHELYSVPLAKMKLTEAPSTGSKNDTLSNLNMPRNQHGQRLSPKTDNLLTMFSNLDLQSNNDLVEDFIEEFDKSVSDLDNSILSNYRLFQDTISQDDFVKINSYRYRELVEDYRKRLKNILS